MPQWMYRLIGPARTKPPAGVRRMNVRHRAIEQCVALDAVTAVRSGPIRRLCPQRESLLRPGEPGFARREHSLQGESEARWSRSTPNPHPALGIDARGL